MRIAGPQLTFAECLTVIRRRSGLRQKTVAHRCGMDPSYLASLETGRRNPPSSKVLARLLDSIEASPQDRAQLNRLAFAHSLQVHVTHRAPPDWPDEGSKVLAAVSLLSPSQLKLLGSFLKVLNDKEQSTTTAEIM
jgi:transcriptional regulator with XRE-family HTH domain